MLIFRLNKTDDSVYEIITGNFVWAVVDHSCLVEAGWISPTGEIPNEVIIKNAEIEVKQ